MEFGKWTKLSEELPPEPQGSLGTSYLATVANNQVVSLRYEKAVIRGKVVYRWSYQGRIAPWNVIAYMPYPDAFAE